MCFFIQSCEPLEKLQKKSTKKKKHIILSWALCPTCLPFLPLSTLLNWQKHDSGQLACGGNPNSAAVWGKVPNRGKSCPLLLFHSWNALGLSAALCSRAGSVPAWDAGASPSALCSSWLQVQSSSWPSLLQVGVVQALLGWAVTLLCSNCKRIGHQLPDGDLLSLSQHTHVLATAALCDSALFSRSGCSCVQAVVHYLHCLSFLLEHRLLFLD